MSKRKKKPLDEFVRPRSEVQINQTGAGAHQDRRTRRARARDAKEREALHDQEDDE